MDRARLKAYGFAFLAMTLFTLEATFARLIGPDINAPQVALVRSLVQFGFLALWMRGALHLAFRTTRITQHVGRGILSAIGSVAYYYVFASLPLATATVVFFGSILFTTMAAGPLLGETVGWRRWSATLIGFAGIVIVVRPTTVTFDLPMLVAILLAVNGAAITLATKGLTRTEPTEVIMGYIALTTIVVNLPWSLATWTMPTAWIWTLTVVIGVVGTLGQWASISSFQGADASGVAQVHYLRIVLAAVIGAFLFAETPDAATILGAALVTAAALYLTVGETRAAPRPTRPAGEVPP